MGCRPLSATLDHVYAFGDFTLDLDKGTLSRPQGEAFLRPKAHSLLAHLARNMGRVVPKSELMDTVWPDVYVTEDSLTQSIREIRKALGEGGQELIRTVSRRGYMLAGKPDAIPETTGQPIVAVLRFRNEGGDAADNSLVDGFAEGIINGLARFGTVTVLARNSSFHFASYDQSERSAAATRIGADYLVEGSVRRLGQSAVIAVNLSDANKLVQLWGEHYEARDLELFAVQRQIGEQIVHRLASRLGEVNLQRAAIKPAANLAAFELVVRADDLLRRYVRGDAAEARGLLEEALRRDASYGLAYIYLALARIIGGGYGSASRAVLEDALALATRGVALAPDQSQGHRVVAVAHLYLREHAAAEHELRLAVALNPCDADSLAQMGCVLALRGRPLDALAWLDRAVKLNPIYPQYYNYDRSMAHYLLGQYREAAEALERAPRLSPWIRTRLAASYAQLGDADTARRHAARINESDVSFSAIAYARDGVAFEHQADRAHLVEGVTMALGLLGAK